MMSMTAWGMVMVMGEEVGDTKEVICYQGSAGSQRSVMIQGGN